eukprot:CAMPEP_0202969886 /NCGR_PEP_ID=MMETSP1396-20130829/15790_1 /ASSEMBLY_ACC=CAM_ASM_000872 /TAXON_ID= /ORGANISM="Pseudokeronopsis sp., Strain Brazil" /LENGTH=62 /DNA_ID=CAMNT_0049697941 /DNA_START=150 /DNA_END=335 /DNA_ORIENTATION=-
MMVIEGSTKIEKYVKEGIHTLQWNGLTQQILDDLHYQMAVEGSYDAGVMFDCIMHKASYKEW